MKRLGFSQFLGSVTAYYLLSGLFQLVIVSLISFFHFLLDHKLGVIEDWVFDKGWEIVVLVKVLSFLVIQKFVHLPSLSRQPFRDMVIETWKIPSRNLFALCIAGFLISIFSAVPITNFHQGANIFKAVISYTSISILFLLDVLMIISIRYHNGFGIWGNRFAILILALLFWFANKVLFPFAVGFGAREFFLHLAVLQLAMWGRDNWADPVFFIAFIIAPMAALIGLDPVWGDRFSMFTSSSHVDTSVSVACALWILSLGFIWWRTKTERFD